MKPLTDESSMDRFTKASNKPLVGIPLGKFRLTVRVAGQKFHTEIQGKLFDATSRFNNPSVIRKFKTVVSEEIQSIYDIKELNKIFEETGDVFDEETWLSSNKDLIDKTDSPTPDIEAVLKLFRAFPMGKICRFLILEEDHSSDKHIIVQFGRLNVLTEYASLPSRLDRGLVRGQEVTFACSGWGLSLPTKRKMPSGIGKGYIHWMIPDDPNVGSNTAVKILKPAEALVGIVPYMHQTMEIKEYKKAKEEQLKAKDDALVEMGAEASSTAVELDFLTKIVRTFRRHDAKTGVVGKKPDFMDFILYAAPTLLFSLLGLGVGELMGTFAGMVCGLITGGYLTIKRR